jgi:preprotein translocase subunit SecE
MFQKIGKYFHEVGQELSKVSWPSREQVYGATVVVVVLCLALSVFILGIDLVLGRLLEILFPKG